MALESSVSSSPTPHWDYIPTGLGRSGRSLSENNFAKEKRDWLSILLREGLQNALDAKVVSATAVRVSVNLRELDSSGKVYMSQLIGREHLDRLKESAPHLLDANASEISTCLVIEDFGTTGLTGRLDDPELEGKGQNWNAFWFREGEGGKENSSGNGGAGQGKITYFSTSAVRTIFALTVRADDQAVALFGASSFLRDYSYNSRKWKRDSYWGRWTGSGPDQKVQPVLASGPIEMFRQKLGLKRGNDQTGLSLVIPSPKAIDFSEAVQIVLAEFYVPILRGDLIVDINSLTLQSSNVAALADQLLTDQKARQLHTCTTKAYREFLGTAVQRSSAGQLTTAELVSSSSPISEKSFSEDALREMREAIDNEQIVSVRFPLNVKPKSGGTVPCYFDVHLACPYEIDEPEQAVIRKDLLIGEEPIGGGRLRQRARGLTLISSDELSRLLLTAEEATHLRWNARLPRLSEYYRSGADTIALVRNAMSKLLEVLTGGEAKKDFKLLAKYFSTPGALAAEKAKGRKPKKAKELPPVKDIPPPKIKLLSLDALEDGCLIKAARSDALDKSTLPMDVKVEFAYEGLDKDAFSEYDPLDFDLEETRFNIQSSGCEIISRSLNMVEFRITEAAFSFKLTGFDKHLRLRIRMNYEEATDAAAIDTE